MIGGRPFVTPDDIRGVAQAVLAHRLVISPELDGDAKVRESIVDEAIQRVGYRRAARPA
jgi:MoxR-like ATPase